MKPKDVNVLKASGETEPFSTAKLISSLKSSGAGQDEIEQVADELINWVYDGITTRQIYKRAYELLQIKRIQLGSRYKLKKAIMELGPTGFPFEYFVARIFEIMGFTTQTGQIMKGCCVAHEMDVIAIRNHEEHLVECKYSQNPGKIVSVQVPLYVRSRIDDIIKHQKELPEYNGFTFHGWVATNTRFSSDAVDYSKCSGLNLIGWDYPQGNGMKDIIDREKIYPITVLTYLTQKQKQYLLNNGIVICRQILITPEVLDPLQLNSTQYNSLL